MRPWCLHQRETGPWYCVHLAGDRLIVLNEEGSLFVVKASSQGYRELARAEGVLPGICWTAPTLSQGRLYLRNDKGSVRCLDLN